MYSEITKYILTLKNLDNYMQQEISLHGVKEEKAKD